MGTNYIITKGRLWDQLKYSLFKLLDWSVGHAVCITHTEDGAILIDDCPTSLQNRLKEKVGGDVLESSWGALPKENINIYDVIREVTEWINEQK